MSSPRPVHRGRLLVAAAALCLSTAGCSTAGTAPGPEPAPEASATTAPPAAPPPSTTPSPSSPRVTATSPAAPRPGTSLPATAAAAASSTRAPAPSASVDPDATARARELEARLEQARAQAAASSSASPSAPSTVSVGPALPAVLAPSRPLRVRIPSVGVDSELMELGIQEDGTVEVPPPGPGSPAGWYRHSPTPGARGPAVLLGHSNNRGDGVFDRLPALTPGEVVQVDRADGSTAVFVVDRAEDYGKDGFPTEQVYGNTLGAELRLITCGDYDPWTGRWNANHVVYASLAG